MLQTSSPLRILKLVSASLRDICVPGRQPLVSCALGDSSRGAFSLLVLRSARHCPNAGYNFSRCVAFVETPPCPETPCSSARSLRCSLCRTLRAPQRRSHRSSSTTSRPLITCIWCRHYVARPLNRSVISSGIDQDQHCPDAGPNRVLGVSVGPFSLCGPKRDLPNGRLLGRFSCGMLVLRAESAITYRRIQQSMLADCQLIEPS